jgi:hypothetical protein
MAGVAVAGAAAQWQNSQAAQKASNAERERMQEVITKLQNPNFDPRDFTSEEYSVAAKYVPEVAKFIEEKAPDTVKTTADGQAGREAQMAALGRLRNLSETGEDTQSQIMRQRALGDAAAQNNAQQATIQQNAAQRGVGGSGMEFMQAMMNQQGSAQSASRNAQDAALASYQNRLSAMRDSANLGGQVRGQDFDEQSKNVGIINDYNQRKTADANRYNQYVANANNQGNMYNIGNQQRVADANVGGRNADMARAQGRKDMIEREGYNANMNKANMNIGMAGQNIQGINQAAGDRAQAIGGMQQAANTGISGYSAGQNSDRDYELRKKEAEYKYGRG